MMSHNPSLAERARAAKRERNEWNAILDGLGSDPSRERDVAYDAWDDARKLHRDLVLTSWLYRLAARVPAYQNNVLEQA